MEFFSKSRGSGHWGACCPRGSPPSPSLRRRVGVWERWVAQLRKLSLRTWLASEGHSQGGQVRPLSLRTQACARLGGDAGVHGCKVQKGGASRGGDATCGPSDPPNGKGPLFAHKWGQGQRCYNVLSFHPTTCRYIGLPPFLFPPSTHKGLCTFTISSYWLNPILLPPALYNIHLVLRYDLFCTIHISEPLIWPLVVLGEFRSLST